MLNGEPFLKGIGVGCLGKCGKFVLAFSSCKFFPSFFCQDYSNEWTYESHQCIMKLWKRVSSSKIYKIPGLLGWKPEIVSLSSDFWMICFHFGWFAGLSLKSQELTAIFLAVRLYCSFVMEYDIHTLLDTATLIFTMWVIYMIRFKLRSTYMEDKDNFAIYYVVSEATWHANIYYNPD